MSSGNAPLPDKPLAGADAPLDEIMLAMDVVDTLRHDQAMLERDLTSKDREADLIKRLREIYHAQGIEVPDHILKEGVAALEDERFAYHPPKAGLGTSLAKIYINRARWGRPLIALAALCAFVWTAHFALFEVPQKSAARQTQTLLTQTLPQQLEVARDEALSIAKTEPIKSRVMALYNDGMIAVQAQEVARAESAASELKALSSDLRQSYAIRIVSRPGESSGIFRLNDDNAEVKNYYLIVEAVNSSGEIISVPVQSEEDQTSQRVSIWGVRVPAAVYNKVAADKRDDQIIQDAIIGAKARGALEPEYSVETFGGNILKW